MIKNLAPIPIKERTMNNKYIIKARHPLLRAGLIIETESSERYVVDVVNKLMELIRGINHKGENDGE